MCSPSQPASAPSSQTVTQSNVPDWAIPYATETLGKAQALTDISKNPYQQYKGERVAGFDPMQQQAFTNLKSMAPSDALTSGIAGATAASTAAGNLTPYETQTFGNQYDKSPEFNKMQLDYLTANSENFGKQSAQDYMSPYQQNVTDFQKQQAIMDYGRSLPGQNAQAVGSGAFGGSRQAIAYSEGQRNLQNQLGGIQALGSQNAYQNAQQQFNADQARRMQAQLANQGAYAQQQGLGMQQNLAGNQQAMQNAQLSAQYGLAGQQATEQSKQFGANYGLQGIQQQLAAAGQLGQLGQTQYGQQMGINQAQQQAGAQQQALAQQGLTNQYQDFLAQQRYPYQQLGFMSDITRGTPSTSSVQTMYQAPPSGTNQLLAAGLGAYGVGKMFKKGGKVKGYKKGGLVMGKGLAELGLYKAMGGAV